MGYTGVTEALAATQYTADHEEVCTGVWYWSNDLRPVRITGVSHAEGTPGGPLGIVVWLDTTGGLLDGTRLARRYPRGLNEIAPHAAPHGGETPEEWATRSGLTLAEVTRETMAALG